MQKIKEIDFNFYKRVTILTLPIIVQNLIGSLLNMMDTIMIGRLGEIELASVGIANQYFFFYCLMLFGINAGSAMFISQFWGKKDAENIKKTTGIALILSLAVSILFTMLAVLKANNIIALFNPQADVVNYGSSYLSIVSISYIFTAITLTYAFASRAIENTFMPMIANLVALVVNVLLNYILIFGNFGFPPLGVKGAAVATVIARIVECFILVFYVYYKKLIINVKRDNIKQINKSFTKTVFLGMTPVLINEFVWGLGNITYNIIYARIGVSATATIQITTTIMNLFMIIIMGLGNSSVVIIGKEIGAKNIKRGKLYAKRLCRLSLVIGAFIGVIVFFTAQYLVLIFKMSPSVLLAAQRTLQVNAIILLLRTFNFMMIVGILRAGGDSKYAVVTQGITMWFIGIPLAFVSAFILKWPVYLVVALCSIEEMVKMFILSRRFKSGKWIHDITIGVRSNKTAA